MKEAKIDELFFEKISKYERLSEPVTVSFPFAEGRLRDERMLLIKDQERVLPIQTRVLSRWKDKSIKWLLVHLRADLPGNASKKLSFELTDSPMQLPPPSERVKIQESKKGLIIDTGVLSFLVNKEGFYPIRDIKLKGKRLWNEEPFQGFKLSCAGRQLCSAPSPVEIVLEESGPLQAVVLIKGKHRTSSKENFIDFRGRITAYAGKPYLEVEHWFFHREDEKELQLKELLLDFRPPSSDVKARLALTEGYSLSKIEESDERLEKAISADTLLYYHNENLEDCFQGIHPLHGISGIRCIEPISEVLTIHPYFKGKEMEKRGFEGLLDDYVEFSLRVKKPLLATETCWGSLDDLERARIIRYTLGQLNKRKIGWIVHALHHSLVADLHRAQFGPMSKCGHFSFIEADGSLRPYHQVWNEFA